MEPFVFVSNEIFLFLYENLITELTCAAAGIRFTEGDNIIYRAALNRKCARGWHVFADGVLANLTWPRP